MADVRSGPPVGRLVRCAEGHLTQIQAIFNDEIATSTSLWDYAPRSEARMQRWWAAKQAGGFPVWGLIGGGEGPAQGPAPQGAAPRVAAVRATEADRAAPGAGRAQGCRGLGGPTDAAQQGAVSGPGRAESLMAFGSYGPFRGFAAYKYTVECSVYVRRDCRRRGLGRRILVRLVQSARESGFKTLVAAITADNQASLSLHQSCGFESCGVLRQAGFKFGRWMDLALYQRVLDGPESPSDG